MMMTMTITECHDEFGYDDSDNYKDGGGEWSRVCLPLLRVAEVRAS